MQLGAAQAWPFHALIEAGDEVDQQHPARAEKSLGQTATEARG
jgi:hypothetical protein